jgi:hypothetical protein
LPRAQNGAMVELAAWPMKATLSDLVATPARSPCLQPRRRELARRQRPPDQFWLSPLATAPVPMPVLIEMTERYAHNNELDRLSARCHIRRDKQEPNRDHGRSQ